MRPSVATVLSNATWEREFITTARMAGMVRVVRRCQTPFDVEMAIEHADAIIVGSETPWINPPLLRRWHATGTAVVAMVAHGDRPAIERMRAAGVDAIFDHDEPAMRVITAVVSLAATEPSAATTAVLATVVGPRGSPGSSEIALSMAWLAAERHRTLLAETDTDAPGLGIRLGLVPGPGLDRSDPALGTRLSYRRHERIEILTLPLDVGPLSRSLAGRVIEMARQDFGAVVIDGGPHTPDSLGNDPGVPVLVVDPTPSGLVRAGRMVASWTGPTPIVVANRVPDGASRDGALRMVRAATGLEPMAVVPACCPPVCGGPPDPGILAALADMDEELFGTAQRSAAR